MAAQSWATRAAGLFRELGDLSALTTALTGLGVERQKAGDYAAARQHHQQTLALARELGEPDNGSYAVGNLGIVALLEGDYGTAWAHLTESLQLAWEASRRHLAYGVQVAIALAGLGAVAVARARNPRDRLAEAARILGAAAAGLAARGATLEPGDREPNATAIAAARAALGEAAFAREWAAGQALGLEEAIALALAQPAEDGPAGEVAGGAPGLTPGS